jgi:hypothetical protein
MEKENRINIKDLPQAEQELTAEESNEIQGGLSDRNGNLQIADLTSVAIDPSPAGARISKMVIDS